MFPSTLGLWLLGLSGLLSRNRTRPRSLGVLVNTLLKQELFGYWNWTNHVWDTCEVFRPVCGGLTYTGVEMKHLRDSDL